MPRHIPEEELEILILQEEIYDLKCKVATLEGQLSLSRLDPNMHYDAREEPKVIDYTFEEFRLACNARVSRQPFGYHIILRGGLRPDEMIELRYMITDDVAFGKKDTARWLANLHKKILIQLVGQFR